MAERTGFSSMGSSYFAATRHPWACFGFLLPLIAAYEFGVHWIGGENPNSYRNGADVWLRWLLERYGVGQLWAAPLFVLGWFLVRSLWNRHDRPRSFFSTLFGMLIESTIFALLLWGFSRNFHAILQQLGLPLMQVSPSESLDFKTPAIRQLITFIGAGIYEEVLFRLGLFSLLVVLLRTVLLPGVVAVPLAAAGAAVAFAAAHHIGPHGEWPINSAFFVFRVLAGLYFTVLYVARGFGIAVGAHAGYDILVGVAVQPAAIVAPN